MKVSIGDDLRFPTAYIVSKLLTTPMLKSSDQHISTLLELTVGRLCTHVRIIRFLSAGLLVTNTVWVLNAIGVFQ